MISKKRITDIIHYRLGGTDYYPAIEDVVNQALVEEREMIADWLGWEFHDAAKQLRDMNRKPT